MRDAETITLPLTVERLTYGPDALAHAGGHVVFVPYGAPGDEIRARVRRREADFLRAEIETLVRPGADRTTPPCPAFGRCGGCQWQHVTLAAQRRAKRAIVAEQLARLGGLPDVEVRPTLAPPAGFAYRSRVTLAAEGRRLGYHGARSHRLEEVPSCSIAAPAIDAHLETARALTARLRTAPTRLTIAEVPGGVAFVVTLPAPATPPDVEATEALLVDHASIRGVVLVHERSRTVLGDPAVRIELEPGLALEAPADAFTQVNAEANRLLVRTVVELGGFTAGSNVLDLYCGAGNFALPLARRGVRVVGVERDPVAVQAARANAARLGLDARFVASDVVAALGEHTEPVDGVLLDPPRAGAAAALPALIARAPRRIAYVSCDPATLARDLGVLARHGHAVRAVQPIDLFPQTFHVETIAILELT
jgi:23S rRNA (uracil1939-C5)-methyltransferase